MILAVKWVPRSELTLKGSLNLEKMWFINRQAVSVVSLGAERHSIHFVNSQTTVRKYLLPVFTMAGVLPSLFGYPTMGRSFLSFAVVLSGLDLKSE